MELENLTCMPTENYLVLILNRLVMGFSESVVTLLFIHALRLVNKCM